MSNDELIDTLCNLKEIDLAAVLEGLKYHLDEHSDHPNVVAEVFNYREELDIRDAALDKLGKQCDEIELERDKLKNKVEEVVNLLGN